MILSSQPVTRRPGLWIQNVSSAFDTQCSRGQFIACRGQPNRDRFATSPAMTKLSCRRAETRRPARVMFRSLLPLLMPSHGSASAPLLHPSLISRCSSSSSSAESWAGLGAAFSGTLPPLRAPSPRPPCATPTRLPWGCSPPTRPRVACDRGSAGGRRRSGTCPDLQGWWAARLDSPSTAGGSGARPRADSSRAPT